MEVEGKALPRIEGDDEGEGSEQQDTREVVGMEKAALGKRGDPRKRARTKNAVTNVRRKQKR